MKKLLIIVLGAGTLFFSCKETTSQSESKTEETTPERSTKKPATNRDTARTRISIGKDGGGFENKKGTGVSVDKNGMKVKTRDVKIDIGDKPNP